MLGKVEVSGTGNLLESWYGQRVIGRFGRFDNMSRKGSLFLQVLTQGQTF